MPLPGQGLPPNGTHQPRRVLRAAGCMRLLAKQAIVVRVTADPEPQEPIARFDAQGTMVPADAHGPKAPDLLEVEGRMSRIMLQSRIRLICERPHFRWQRVVSRPEGRRGVVVQRDVVLPAAWSRRAFSARASSFPA